MSSLWRNNKATIWKRRPSDQEQPVLDQRRNKITTFENFSSPKPTEIDYLRQKGYQIIGQIGRGGYGVVYKAKTLEEQSRICAIKVNYDVVARSTIYFEVAFFHLVRKKSNLPKMIDFFFVRDTPYIVLEYFEHEQFIEIFDKVKDLKEVKHYLFEMLKGVNTLKNIGIYHRDIKPMNFLYDFNAKKGIIIDFGLAEIDQEYVQQVVLKKYEELKSKVPEKQWKLNEQLLIRKQELNIYDRLMKANKDVGVSKIGTQSYVPLQTILRCSNQGHECQIWSIGIVLLLFLTQKTHFFNEPRDLVGLPYQAIFVMQLAHIFGAEAVQQQVRKLGWKVVFPKKMPEKGDLKKMIVLKSKNPTENQQAYDLLQKFLALSPQSRISAEDAVWHPFFDQVREQHFRSESQIKWYKKQIQKRNPRKQAQQLQEPIQQKSMSNVQAQSSFSKSFRKIKGEQLLKQQQESSNIEAQIGKLKQKRKTTNQQEGGDQLKKVSGSSHQQISFNKQEENKQCEQVRNLQRDSRKPNENKIESEDDQKKGEEVVKPEDIMTTIRKYISERQITTNEAAVSRNSDRIDINIQTERQKAKNPKVIRKPAGKTPGEEPKDKKVKKKQKQAEKQKEKKQEKEKNKQKEDGKLRKNQEDLLKVDEKLQQILRKEQERIKMEVISRVEIKKIVTKIESLSEDYCDSDDT